MNQDEVEEAPPNREIIYDNRDILNLAANIQWKWECKTAVLQSGTSYFFENRSQYSRVLGAHIPEHFMVTCSIEGCLFNEPHYE